MERCIRILLVEDEQRMAEALHELLHQEGYLVHAVTDGTEGMAAIVDRDFDLAILDVMLPGVSGFEIASAAREAGRTLPILMLTARSDVEDRVVGLDSGADDYLTKPFDTRELLARIRAMTRRCTATDEGRKFEDIVLFPDQLLLSNASRNLEVCLTVRESKLLNALMEAKGKTISREQLAVRAFGYQDESEYNNVEVYLTFLRRKLKYLGSSVEIKAQRGLGYQLRGAARV